MELSVVIQTEKSSGIPHTFVAYKEGKQMNRNVNWKKKTLDLDNSVPCYLACTRREDGVWGNIAC